MSPSATAFVSGQQWILQRNKIYLALNTQAIFVSEINELLVLVISWGLLIIRKIWRMTKLIL